MLKKGWFVQDSIEKTLENLIAESELAHIIHGFYNSG